MSESDVLALALAVVKPGGNARLIDEWNGADPEGWVSIEAAVSSGRAFFVDVKPTLAAFDLDTPKLVGAGDWLREWAEGEGLPTLLVSSGREGHRHLYIRTDDRDAVNRRAVAVGVVKSAHRQTIRPPLAPHRLRLKTALIAPETVEKALEVLGPSERDVSKSTNLPVWLVSLINDGDTEAKYAGRAPMALAVASGLRRAGYDFTTFRAVMTNRTNGCSAKYFALLEGEGSEDPDKFLVRVWDKSAEQLSPQRIVADIEKVRALVMADQWQGRTGNTDRSVMLALCELGTTSVTTVFAFGSRRIAEVAQVQEKTAQRALRRLVDAGWLERVKAAKIGDSDTYRFGPDVDKMTAHSSPPIVNERTMWSSYGQLDDDRVLMHPVFRNGSGLGRGPGATWLTLRNLGRPVTAQEIAEAIDGSRRTIDRHLKALSRHGLAVKTGSRWEAGGDSRRLDELAVELGSVERAIRQVEQNERNREGFRTALRLKGARQQGAADELTDEDKATIEAQVREEIDPELADEERRRWESGEWPGIV
ncbi:helix-turn-helix domain-containing protein [Nocardia sp. NBC_01499]|uniref:helix-turn-helix domain-containing protein n=1 Tax=Nocardia sp. NBC_01499 TaxID=2903597 RepID=UPI00386A4829